MSQPTSNEQQKNTDTNMGMGIETDPRSVLGQTVAVDHTDKYKRQNKKITYVYLFLLVVLGFIFFLVVTHSQSISDWFRLRGYHPPAQVTELVTEDAMTPYTAHLFYLNRPQIFTKVATFRKYCPENENTIVLGCYHPDQDGIFIYDVQDQTLAGVEQVTAAHEVLHAVYARLTNSQRQYVDGLLESYDKHGLTDPIVEQEVKLYQQTEPGSVMDEMNSTFGTEIADLPAPLEAYYRQYFSDRGKIVAYESQYENQLTSRLDTVSADDSQLTQMQKSIDGAESQLNSEYTRISAQRATLNQLLAANQYAAYNQQVDAYNGQVDSYNAQLTALKAEINSYNNLIATRNNVAGQLTTLDQALDTRLTQQPAK